MRLASGYRLASRAWCVWMTHHDIDIHDATDDDHEQFERRQLARDRDRRERASADLDSDAIRELVAELIDDGVVAVDGTRHHLVHQPTGKAFTSRSAVAHFHRGWATATSPDDDQT